MLGFARRSSCSWGARTTALWVSNGSWSQLSRSPYTYESADDEDAGHGRQRVYGAISMRRVLSDDVEVQRQGDKDQAGKNAALPPTMTKKSCH